jgi:hypothetical protein
MEFTTEVKDAFQEQITVLKNMLGRLSKEINEIEQGNTLEFILPLMTLNSVIEEAECMREDLRSWQDEDVDETEFP